VPVEEARLLLGENAIEVYGFDRGELGELAGRVGLRPADILKPLPPGVKYRGDINRPLSING
jgi:hypothetical protein